MHAQLNLEHATVHHAHNSLPTLTCVNKNLYINGAVLCSSM